MSGEAHDGEANDPAGGPIDRPISVLAVAVRESGLVPAGFSGVALVSGGADSACLAAGLVAAVGAERVLALHLNYRLRPDSDSDEATARALCDQLGIELVVEHPHLAGGNVQAAARDARYAAAEALRADHGLDWVATGHTRTDLAETMLYRLASSPGRRALLGLPPRRGHLIRPLLALGRDETRALAEGAGLPFRDDPSNEDPAFARARIRRDVLPVLRDINGSAEEHISATWAELAEEGAALDAVAAQTLAGAGDAAALGTAVLEPLHPGIRRLVLRAFFERTSGQAIALSRERAETIWRLLQTREGGEVDLGAGWRALCEAGHVRIAGPAQPPPEPVALPVPGSCRFGDWELRAATVELGSPERAERELAGLPPDSALLDAAIASGGLTVRAWRDGDRIRALGLGGSKSLQDLFTDSRIPRSLRRRLPVVEAGDGRIVWVAGVAAAEDGRVGQQTARAIRLDAAAYTGAR